MWMCYLQIIIFLFFYFIYVKQTKEEKIYVYSSFKQICLPVLVFITEIVQIQKTEMLGVEN